MANTVADIRNLALIGPAGGGKTLLAEALLTQAGAIRAKGNLQRGTTVCDFDPQEKRLQHSLDAAICTFETDGTRVNLIDTPGYPDFIGRSLSVLEAVETAALVVSATSGVDPITQRLMDFAHDRELCRIVIVNKIDSKEAKTADVLAQIREQFGRECLPVNLPAEGGKTVVDCFFQPRGEATDFSSVAAAHTEIIDQVVELDEKLMALYLEQGEELDPRSNSTIRSRQALRQGHLIPVCFVSAETGAGIDELLDGVPQADAESRRGQSAAVPQGRRRGRRARGGDARPGEARGRPRVQGHRGSFRRQARPVPGAPGHGEDGLAAVRRRRSQALQGRAPVPADGQGPSRDPAGAARRHLPPCRRSTSCTSTPCCTTRTTRIITT